VDPLTELASTPEQGVEAALRRLARLRRHRTHRAPRWDRSLAQEDQVRCFENVAAHLADNGVFALEAFVPDVARFDRRQRLGAITVELDGVQLEATSYDPIAQRSTSQRIFVSAAGIELAPVAIRFAAPAELDLMARLAGYVR
jgi:hypothetical protein